MSKKISIQTRLKEKNDKIIAQQETIKFIFELIGISSKKSLLCLFDTIQVMKNQNTAFKAEVKQLKSKLMQKLSEEKIDGIIEKTFNKLMVLQKKELRKDLTIAKDIHVRSLSEGNMVKKLSSFPRESRFSIDCVSIQDPGFDVLITKEAYKILLAETFNDKYVKYDLILKETGEKNGT